VKDIVDGNVDLDEMEKQEI